MSIDVVDVLLTEATISAYKAHLCEVPLYFKKLLMAHFQKLMSVQYLSRMSPNKCSDCSYTGLRCKLPKVVWKT